MLSHNHSTPYRRIFGGPYDGATFKMIGDARVVLPADAFPGLWATVERIDSDGGTPVYGGIDTLQIYAVIDARQLGEDVPL